MNHRFAALPFLLLFAACAPMEVDPEFAVPTCSSERECDAKWNASEIWIKHNIRREITTRTDTMMQTAMDQSPGNYLSARVHKEHVEGNTWRINAQMYCARKTGCDPSPWEATQSFNRAVNNSWVPARKQQREEPFGK